MQTIKKINLKREIKDLFDIYLKYYNRSPKISEIAKQLSMDEIDLLRYMNRHQDTFTIKKIKYKNRYIPILSDVNYNYSNSIDKKDNKILYVKEIYDNNFWLLGYILDSFNRKNSQETIVTVLDLLKIDYNNYGFQLNDISMDGFFIPVNGIETLKQIFKYKIVKI